MAEFTAKDVQALRQSTGRRDDGRQEGARRRTTATWTPPPSGSARRAWRRPPVAPTATTAEGAVAVALSGSDAAIVELKCETDFVAKSDQFVTAGAGAGRRWSRPRARAPSSSARTPSTTSRSPSRRTSSSAAWCASRAARATSSTPTCTARTGAASTASSSSSTAARRSWRTTSPCTSPSPSPTHLRRDDIPEAEVAEERETLEEHHPRRGQARGRARQDRRGSPQRLVRRARAARADVRQGREALDRSSSSATVAPSSSGSRRSSIGG